MAIGKFKSDASDYEEIPLDALEDEDVSESVDTSDKQPQDNTELHEKVETVSLQPRAAQPRAQAAAQPQAQAVAQADAVSTNTNSALSDAMASTQSILLDTGASLTRHIAQKSRADAEKTAFGCRTSVMAVIMLPHNIAGLVRNARKHKSALTAACPKICR